MVNQDIVNYLRSGTEKGFTIERLKSELLRGGFREKEIDFAIKSLGPVKAKKEEKHEEPAKKEFAEEKLGVFKKIGKALAHPIQLFEATKSEGVWPALKFYLLILIIPFIIASIFILLYVKTILFVFFGIGTLSSLGIIAILNFVANPVFVFVAVAISHLFIKIFKGQGGYSDTYRAIIYSSAPSTLFGWIPFVGLGALIWSFVLVLYGISTNHKISKWRAFFALIFPLILIIVLLIILILLIPSPQPFRV